MSRLFLSAEETVHVLNMDPTRLAPWLRDRLGLDNLPRDVQIHVEGPDPGSISRAWIEWTAPVTTFTSPDGGHTVYRHDGTGRHLHSQSDQAVRRQRVRRLQQVLIIADQDPAVLDYLETQLEPVLAFAALKGHDTKT